MDNMYDQTPDMELFELEEQVVDLQNGLISSYELLSELWVYHPSNPNFINPIALHEKLKLEVEKMEVRISDLQNRIKALRSTN